MTTPVGSELFSSCRRHGSAPSVLTSRTARGAAARLAALPPTFFAIALGLAGLALAWRAAATVLGAPTWVAPALFTAAAAVWFALIVGLLLRLVSNPRAVAAQLADPVLSPFMAVPAVITMLLAVGLRPYAGAAANIIALAGLTVTIALGGWLAGQWIAGKINPAHIHPGYFLPTVAGGFVGANVMGVMGHRDLGWLSFGIGVICWMQLGPVILNRLLTGPPLATGLVPTLAIEVAPPAVAGNAYLALHHGPDNPVVYGLAGFCVLLLVVQLRLAPLFRRLRFAPTFWTFTFSYSAVATFALQLIGREHPDHARLLGWLVLGAITAFVGVVFVRTSWAIGARRFFPAVTPGPKPEPATTRSPRSSPHVSQA